MSQTCQKRRRRSIGVSFRRFDLRQFERSEEAISEMPVADRPPTAKASIVMACDP
jgi:hypothetical protein